MELDVGDCCICLCPATNKLNDTEAEQRWYTTRLRWVGVRGPRPPDWICALCDRLLHRADKLQTDLQATLLQLRERYLPERSLDGSSVPGSTKIYSAEPGSLSLPADLSGPVPATEQPALRELPAPPLELPAVVFAEPVLGQGDGEAALLADTATLQIMLTVDGCAEVAAVATEVADITAVTTGHLDVAAVATGDADVAGVVVETIDVAGAVVETINVTGVAETIDVAGVAETIDVAAEATGEGRDLTVVEGAESGDRISPAELVVPPDGHGLLVECQERTDEPRPVAGSASSDAGDDAEAKGSRAALRSRGVPRKTRSGKTVCSSVPAQDEPSRKRRPTRSSRAAADERVSSLPLKKRVTETARRRRSRISRLRPAGSGAAALGEAEEEAAARAAPLYRRTSAGRWQCGRCPALFESRSGVYAHALVHVEPGGGLCSTCGRSYANVFALRRHRAVCPGQRPACPICNKEMLDPAYLSEHLRVHAAKSDAPAHHMCEKCGLTFDSGSKLRRHRTSAHTTDTPYRCDICDRQFALQFQMRRHRRDVHFSHNAVTCDVCGQGFKRAEHLRAHAVVHTGDKPFQCGDCGKCFRRADSLADHARLHTGEKPYKCQQCGAAFREVRRRNQHVRGKYCSVGYYKIEPPPSPSAARLLDQDQEQEPAGSPSQLMVALPAELISAEELGESLGSLTTPEHYRELAGTTRLVLTELPGSEHPLDVIGLPDVDDPIDVAMATVSDTEPQ